MGCHFLLQGIFPTQGSNPGLPHCRQTLYHLSHQWSPRNINKSSNKYQFSSVQFSSVAQLCLTLCNPMDCSMPVFPVHHQIPELAWTHVHQVSEAIQPLSSPSSPTFNLSQNWCLYQWITSLHQVPKVLKFQLHLQYFQWIFRTDFLQDWLVWSPCSSRGS